MEKILKNSILLTTLITICSFFAITSFCKMNFFYESNALTRQVVEANINFKTTDNKDKNSKSKKESENKLESEKNSKTEIKSDNDNKNQTKKNTETSTNPETDNLKKTDTVPSRNYTVVIDPGHGGADPGSIGYKTKVHEDELNLKMSLLLKDKLEKAGINIIMTRETDESLAKGTGKAFKKKDMALRKELIKKIRPNMVISLHQNSYTNHSLRGAQVFYDKTSEISKQIAEFIQEEFLKNLEHSNKCTSPGDYFMLKCTSAPSVIVECGFLSNAEEEKLLLTDEYQEKIVNCIYLGIIRFLQIKE